MLTKIFPKKLKIILNKKKFVWNFTLFTRKVDKIPQNSKKFYKILHNSRKFKNIPENSKKANNFKEL